MKKDEITIFDWVDTFPDFCQVLSISSTGQVKTTENQRQKVDYLEGLYLNEGILRHNGFIEQTTIDSGTDFILDDLKHGVEFLIYREGNKGFRLRIQRGPEANLSIKIQYVHELQHAMRLMGLNEMANTFKL